MVEYIQYGDNGKVAREKINNIMSEVEDNIPSIGENGDWYLGPNDTGTPATGPEGPRGPKGQKGDTGESGNDVMTQREYDNTPGVESDDIVHMIRA